MEVACGADSSSTPHQKSPAQAERALQGQTTIVEVPEEHIKTVDYASLNDGINGCMKSDEEVLVHPPPNGMCTDDDVLMIDEDGAVSMSSPKHNGNDAPIATINTGLSQSDLSISSSDGSNRAYCYGAQDTYTVETKNYQSPTPHQRTPQTDRITTPEPITVISDGDHTNECNDNLPTTDEFIAEPLPIDDLNENVLISAVDNDANVIKKTIKNTVTVTECENGNEQYIEHTQLNGKTDSIAVTEINGKLNGKHENGFNGNGNGNEHLIEESSEYDSLINLPAPPPCDDFKTFNTQMENGNLDSLPPPPPELVSAES